jgi:hypothetical protein
MMTINRRLAIATVSAGATLGIAFPAGAAPYVEGPNLDCGPETIQVGTICVPRAVVTPTDAVQMSFGRNGLTVRANFLNISDISGQCHYDAEDVNGLLPGKTDDFPIAPKGSVTRTYPAPPPFSTYHATVSCHGNYLGQDVEFGNTSQDVSG